MNPCWKTLIERAQGQGILYSTSRTSYSREAAHCLRDQSRNLFPANPQQNLPRMYGVQKEHAPPAHATSLHSAATGPGPSRTSASLPGTHPHHGQSSRSSHAIAIPPCTATTPGQVPISVQHLSRRGEHPLPGNPAGRPVRDSSHQDGPGKSFQERLNPAHGQGFMSSPIEADAAEFSPAEFSGEEFSAEEMPLQIVGTTDRGGLHVQGMQQNNNPRQGDLTAGVHNPGEYQGQRSSSIMDRLDLERGRLTDNRSVHQGGQSNNNPRPGNSLSGVHDHGSFQRQQSSSLLDNLLKQTEQCHGPPASN